MFCCSLTRWILDLERPTPVYSFITPFRLLLSQLFKSDIYHDLLQIDRLEHHLKQRQESDLKTWMFHQKFVVNRIKAFLPQLLTLLGPNVTDRQKSVLKNLDSVVHEGVCRLRTNTLQLNTESPELRGAMGLYPIYSYLNHSCFANSTTSKSGARQGFR